MKVEKISNGIIPNFHYRARNCQFRESKMFKSLYIFNSLLHLRDTMIPCSLIKSRIGYLFEILIIYFNTKSECVFSKACHLKNHKRNHKNRLIFQIMELPIWKLQRYRILVLCGLGNIIGMHSEKLIVPMSEIQIT